MKTCFGVFKWQRSGFSLVFWEILSVFFVGIIMHVCGGGCGLNFYNVIILMSCV